MTLVYPDFPILKQLYPYVGVKLLKASRQPVGCVAGNMLIGGKVQSEYAFKGKDEKDLYHTILKANHFIEQKSPKVLNRPAAPVVVSNSESSDHETRTVWVISDTLVERYRVSPSEVQSYLDRGFVSGRKAFSSFVDPAKIEAWTQRCKQVNLLKLKALAKASSRSAPGVDLRKGSRLLMNTSTGERKKFPAHHIEAKLAEGWIFSTVAQDRLKTVNVGVGRGHGNAGKLWIMNPKTRVKKRVPKDELDRLISSGWIKCGARTR